MRLKNRGGMLKDTIVGEIRRQRKWYDDVRNREG